MRIDAATAGAPPRPNGEADPARLHVGRAFYVSWVFMTEGVGDPQCYVYEVSDRHQRVIYVGVTRNFPARWSSHLSNSWWARSVDIDNVLLSGYSSRADARKVEALLIEEHRPPCNSKPERKYLRLARAEGRPDDIMLAALGPTRKF